MGTPLASPSSAVSPSTLAMSPDRGATGKLVGNLCIAAKLLVEGPGVNMEQVRHEIRTLLASTSSSTGTTTSAAPPSHGGAPKSSSSAAASAASPVPAALSPMDWKKFVTSLLLQTQQLPNAIGCLPDALKRDLAAAIRQGRLLCVGNQSAGSQASQRVEEAAVIYRTLSGASYL